MRQCILAFATVSVAAAATVPDRFTNELHHSPEELMKIATAMDLRLTGKEMRAASLESESDVRHARTRWSFFSFKNCYEGVGATSVC